MGVADHLAPQLEFRDHLGLLESATYLSRIVDLLMPASYHKHMQVVTWNQMLGLADIYHDDSEMVRDLKFSHWIRNRRYLIIEAGSLDQVQDTELEIIIIKE